MRKVAGIVALLGILLLACAGGFFPLEIAFYLAFGWLLFLHTVGPQISINWNGILTVTLCLVALAVGLHSFLQWFVNQTGLRAETADQVRRWRPRYTLVILVGVVLMFVAGISSVGIVHLTIWLVTSPEPLMKSSSVRAAADRISSAHNLKELALALHSYHETNQVFPPGGTFGANGIGMHGWLTYILPHMDQGNLFSRINLKIPWTHPENIPSFQVIVPEFVDRRAKVQTNGEGFALSHYASNIRLLGGNVPRSLKSITDGMSNTLMAGEVRENPRPWGHPVNWRDPALGVNTSPSGFGSYSEEGANFVFADGSVRFFSNNVRPEVLRALSTPDGGEVVPTD